MKKLTALLLTLVLVFTCLALPVSARSFGDIPDEAYYYGAVRWAVQERITAGATPDAFRPDRGCTRAQAVTFLWRLAGRPAPEQTPGFLDVPQEEYYFRAVAWAVEKGIVKGMSPTVFKPNGICTRGQIVTMLWRFSGSPLVPQKAQFGDVKKTDWFYEPVSWAVASGITLGMPGNVFRPEKTCTRSQIVTFLHRTYLVEESSRYEGSLEIFPLQEIHKEYLGIPCTYRIPQFADKSLGARRLNVQMAEFCDNRIARSLEELSQLEASGESYLPMTWHQVDYTTGARGAFLSVCVESRYYEHSIPTYRFFNLNTDTGKEASNEDLLAAVGISRERFPSVARAAARAAFDRYHDDPVYGQHGMVPEAEYAAAREEAAQQVSLTMPMGLDSKGNLVLCSKITVWAGGGSHWLVYPCKP